MPPAPCVPHAPEAGSRPCSHALSRPAEAPHARIRLLGQRLVARGATLATAESCTGGLIAALCTDVPGSSAWFTGGVVAYANEVKRDVLRVDPVLLATHGAVSEPVVRAMAAGVRRLTGTRYAVAVSGVAGPDGGTPEKPVGTVWLAVADGDTVHARRLLFPGDRASVRLATAQAAVETLLALLGEQEPPRETDAP
ncbi:CinA family protein [Nitratidesulfovibrio sp. HK-II]|uniref:CinA family protein n=1 Tax=Nitratidesulfovibrio sp. HK-II TaxID=2009266 RepID=UPI003A63AE96